MNESACVIRADVTLSVVSHGQGALIGHLLDDILNRIDVCYEIVLTLNIPEDEKFLERYIDAMPLHIVRNQQPKGFGANHNAAFALSLTPYFAVVNPDIRACPMILRPLVETLGTSHVGACGPVILSTTGRIEDSARKYPTFFRLIRRVVSRVRSELRIPDYTWGQEPIEVDWLAGMFIIFRRDAYINVGGFDERFFMYFEDADICRRLGQMGWTVKLDPRTVMVHDAQRASHRSAKHMRWHLMSALRFLLRRS